MSFEREYDHLMADCGEDGIHIQDYLDHKTRIRGTKHDPRFVSDMYNKVIY